MKQSLLVFSVLSSLGFSPNAALADVVCAGAFPRTESEKFVLENENPTSVSAFHSVSYFRSGKTHTTTHAFSGHLVETESKEEIGSSVTTYSLVDLGGEVAKFVLTSTTDLFGGSCGRGSCRAPTQPVTVLTGLLTLQTAKPSQSIKNFSCYVK